MPPLQPQALTHARQLAVEERAPERFFAAFLQHLGLAGTFQLQNFGPIQDLRPFLQGLRRKRGFTRQVTSLGIVRDAEGSADNAFRSVCDALAAARLPVPAAPAVLAQGQPRVAVFLLPDCAGEGMLEDLCWQAVSADAARVCVEEYFACLQRQGLTVSNPAKARVQAFLASRPKPGLLLGEAASKGYFPWDLSAFAALKQFLHAL